ncbi:uncharacterized protein LOC111320141, partial [Stylophora pistillata]|uniref:uncharacterized protein LOC111320141 n=1 Tax=Stylophora pistillata TaxID=50429 RepID=UPI000C03DE02
MERAHGKLSFKWTIGADKNLFGRIVRIMINCSYSASPSRPPRKACLIFKSSGQITYSTGVNESQVPESGSSTKPGSEAKTTPYISPVTKTTSVTESVRGTRKEDAGTDGIYSRSGVLIGIGAGCALVLGIFIIFLVVACKRRESNNEQQVAKPA